MQRFAAHLSLAVTLAIGCMVPMGFGPPLDGWATPYAGLPDDVLRVCTILRRLRGHFRLWG